MDRVVRGRLALLAHRQRSNLTWEQLRAEGVTAAVIRSRAGSGELIRLFPRVYATADPDLVPLCRESAALLSLGPSAVLSHTTAAAIWGITARTPRRPIEVIVVGTRPRPRPGVRFHHTVNLHPHDVTERHGLRITTPARTLVDLAARSSRSQLERDLQEAWATGLVDHARLQAAAERAPRGHPGAAIIRRLEPDEIRSRSRRERTLAGLIAQARLPQPRRNFPVGDFELDFFWPEHGFGVELDGYGSHTSPRAFVRDRRKEQVMRVQNGIDVMRIAGRQVDTEPYAVIAYIAHSLAQRPAPA